MLLVSGVAGDAAVEVLGPSGLGMLVLMVELMLAEHMPVGQQAWWRWQAILEMYLASQL